MVMNFIGQHWLLLRNKPAIILTYVTIMLITKISSGIYYFLGVEQAKLFQYLLYLLRWLEIVFIFPRLVLQILFQIQFGLSYQCEIYHSNK